MRHFFSLIILITGCTQFRPLTPKALEVHQTEVEAWHAARIANLKSANGWLNLVGLYWLEPGINTFGSDSGNALVFPQGKIVPHAGYFLVKDNTVTLVVNKGVLATVDKDTIDSRLIFHPDSTRAPQVQVGELRWNIISREPKLGVRLRDDKAEAVDTFSGIDRYSTSAEYRVEATLERGNSSRTIEITNVLGQTTAQRSPGTVVFKLKGKTYRLDALEEGDELFIVFADATSGTETYGAGRFVYAKKPIDNEKLILDFNKAYNPPCVFTPYATCPLPPKQNVLPIAIRAGEKNYNDAVLHAAN
jgi:uncharacterized protein (DUF1684 family)